MLTLFFAAYGAVFLAEIVGDKLLYTTGVLATRYRATPILFGLLAAFMAKMGIAVLVGKAISTLPPLLVAAVTAVNFFGLAYFVWRKHPSEAKPDSKPPTDSPASKAAMVSFAAVFFSEWGDVGQITAATLAARYAAPWSVWLGAVGAMVTKGALAASIGAGLRQWIQRTIPPKIVRYAGVGLLLLLGLLSVIETLVEGHP